MAGNSLLFVLPFVIFFGLLSLVLFLDNQTSGYWRHLLIDPLENEVPPWCEADRGPDRFLREPANALTDFAYFAVGLYALYLVGQWKIGETKHPDNFLGTHPGFVGVWGICNILHACGSFWNHACRCHSGHHYDGMK